MKVNVTKEMLFRHFSGETSAYQKQLIDDWASVQANEERFYKWLEEYENLHPEYGADVDRAIDNYHGFLKQHQNKAADNKPVIEPPVLHITRPHWGVWVGSVAASMSVVLIAFAVIKTDAWQFKTLRTEYGETQTFPLSDGSQVTLNANSTLKIPRWGFGKDSRNVFLEGEAAFSVKHRTDDQKFVVQTAKKFEVEVLGTEFTVFARDRGAKVVLNRGRIQINFQQGNTTRKMLMKPGDLIRLDTKNRVEQAHTNHPETHAAWQGHRYVFEQSTLQEVIYLLKENYGLTARVDDKQLLPLTLSGTITATNADQILELIETVLELHVIREGDKVLISQKNAGQ